MTLETPDVVASRHERNARVMLAVVMESEVVQVGTIPLDTAIGLVIANALLAISARLGAVGS